MKPTRFRVGLVGAAIAVSMAWAGMSSIRSSIGAEGDTPPKPPLGLPPVPWPKDNPYSKAKADLGRLLYFDVRLCSDNTVSCATCHAPDKGFTDCAPVSTGIKGQKGGRSAPTVINRAYSAPQFWDGRAATLEEQAKGPPANPIEMTNAKTPEAAYKAIEAKLQASPGYVALFEKAFGPKKITMDNVAKAIATFERTVLSGNSAYDKYKAGDKKAMTEAQVRGMKLFFGKAKCNDCHSGPDFTDGSYANLGIGMDLPNPDMGRYKVTGDEADKGAFKTPSLRDCTKSAPYMHDGSLKTLEDVIEHYNKGGTKNEWLDEKVVPLKLSAAEKTDLVAFIKALDGEGWQMKPPKPEEFPK